MSSNPSPSPKIRFYPNQVHFTFPLSLPECVSSGDVYESIQDLMFDEQRVCALSDLYMVLVCGLDHCSCGRELRHAPHHSVIVNT